jgi:signal transduction histidine kinase/CheY-like chemotaxis protein
MQQDHDATSQDRPDPRDQRISELEERVQQHAAELQRARDELEERVRQRTADLDYLISGVQCLLWHAYVEERDGQLYWEDHVVNEEKAMAIVPVERAPGQSYGSALKALRHPEDSQRMDETGENALRSGRTFYAQDYRCKGANDQWLHLHEEVHIEVLAANRWRLVGVCTDISERVHLEEQLRQSQKMEALGQLTAGIAHNFNNMLQAIIGNIGIMKYRASDEQQIHLQEADKAAQRAAEMVRQLLVFSRKGIKRTYRPLVLEEILGEVVAVCYKTFDRQIEVKLQISATGSVFGDSSELNQVFLNLCLNARDALTAVDIEQPRILIEMDRAPLDTLAPAHTAAEEYLRVRISDNGIGMNEDTRQRVFDPFFTTKAPGAGTGLGLSTALATIEQHRGRMLCSSVAGQGSTFSIYLPISMQETGEQAPSAKASPARGNEKILVIDDESIVRRTVANSLKMCGYTVLEAEDGQRGLEVFRAQIDRIDLVILDLSMPGMSGANVFAHLRALSAEIRVIILSGYSVDKIAGCTPQAIAQKPVAIDQFMNTVRAVLDDHTGGK